MKNFIPKGLSRFGNRSVLKARKHSPTILVVAGVVGMGVTVVAAVKASKKAEVVVSDHKAQRVQIGDIPAKNSVAKDVRKAKQVEVLELYYNTGLELTKVYGPTILLGVLSSGSILYGHKILHGRHLATMTAYSGLMEQFASYRGRIRQTLGEKAELDIYNGAHGEYVEDPNHKGEYKLQPVFADGDPSSDVRRPWFDEKNAYFRQDPEVNIMHLTGVQRHMNELFQVRGHLFLNEVLDALNMPRHPEGQILGWVLDAGTGDNFVDFGFLTNDDPHTVAFRNAEVPDVRLNFNVDGIVMDLI